MDKRFGRFWSALWQWCVKHYILVIIVSAVIAMAISLYIGLNQNVWFDESYSILVAKNSLSHLLYLVSVDTHPPLFYIALKLWGDLFGWSDFALRSLVVLFLGGSILVAGLLVKRLFGIKAAIVTLPFIVFTPFSSALFIVYILFMTVSQGRDAFFDSAGPCSVGSVKGLPSLFLFWLLLYAVAYARRQL